MQLDNINNRLVVLSSCLLFCPRYFGLAAGSGDRQRQNRREWGCASYNSSSRLCIACGEAEAAATASEEAATATLGVEHDGLEQDMRNRPSVTAEHPLVALAAQPFNCKCDRALHVSYSSSHHATTQHRPLHLLHLCTFSFLRCWSCSFAAAFTPVCFKPVPTQGCSHPPVCAIRSCWSGDWSTCAPLCVACLQAFALPVLQIVHETLQAWARGAAMASVPDTTAGTKRFAFPPNTLSPEMHNCQHMSNHALLKYLGARQSVTSYKRANAGIRLYQLKLCCLCFQVLPTQPLHMV